MSETLVNLATVGSDELQAMPVGVFTAGLEQMSGEAIARFRKMRKLSATHRSALEKYLAAHPEKRSGDVRETVAVTERSATAQKQKAAPLSIREAGMLLTILLRMLAWWEGSEPEEVARRKGVRLRQRKPKTRRIVAAPEPQLRAQVTAPIVVEPEATHVSLLQKQWGEGFSLPGGKELALKIAEPVPFRPDGRYLDMTAGLGGGVRAIASHTGALIEAIEASHELAEVALAITDKMDMGEKVTIKVGAPDDVELMNNAYDAILLREVMFAMKDRDGFLTKLAYALKNDGSLVFTDFVFADDAGADDNQLLAEWQNTEDASPWNEAEYRAALERNHYKVERIDDLTQPYLTSIRTGWQRFHNYLETVKLPPETAPILLRETAIWLRRSQALESGRLRLIHVHATRQAS